jgi:hypothetical protein
LAEETPGRSAIEEEEEEDEEEDEDEDDEDEEEDVSAFCNRPCFSSSLATSIICFRFAFRAARDGTRSQYQSSVAILSKPACSISYKTHTNERYQKKRDKKPNI